MKQQPRDKLGRFLSFDGTRNLKFTKKDIIDAFMAGMNATSNFQTPARKLDMYLKSKGIE